MNPNIIDVKNLNVRYAGGRKSVRDCSFLVQRGEVFGLLGSNGAGKSTILKVFAGLIKNFNGEVRICGQNYHELGSANLSSKIAYVPQNSCMFSEFTVYENMMFFASMEGVSDEKKEKSVNRLLGSFSLNKFENVQAGRLSGGYRQLLNIAVSSILDKDIILMDEPTAGLDLWAKQKVASYIKELRAKGKTIILTTHDLADAEELCDNVVILSDGVILAKGNMRKLLKELGGGYTIRVSLRSALDAKSLAFTFSRIISISDRELVVEAAAADIGRAVREIVVKIEEAGVEIEDLYVHEPSLSYVFSNLMSKGGTA